VNVFACSNIVSITILLLTGSIPLFWFLDVRFSYRMFVQFGVKHVILSVNYLLSMSILNPKMQTLCEGTVTVI
jgi:hypothetical protein